MRDIATDGSRLEEPAPAPGREGGAACGGAADRIFAGPGEMRARCRALDWSATPLGSVEDWPQSLRTAVSVCLASGFPKLVMWGPELVQLYNDAFVSVLHAKHPAALGQRARDCWPELWDRIGPMYRDVLETGASIFLEDQLFQPERRGYVEEAYFTFSYSAIADEAHRPAGILATVIETTRHVQSRGERERVLERLNAQLRAAAAESESARRDAEEARATAERTAAALIGSEARFRTVQDTSPHGLVLLRPERDGGADGGGRIVDFRIQYANPAGGHLTGQRPEAMVGHTLLELFPATRELGLFDAYVQVVETGVTWEDDVRYVADGLAAGYRLAAVRVGEGAAAELGLLYADATARLVAEAERARLLAQLEAERERLRTVILQTPAPLALLEGPEHRFALVNAAYKRVSGGGRDVTGLTPREAFPELAGSGIHELFDRVYQTGEPWDSPESPVRYDRDGTGVQDTWFNLRFEPVRDEAGRVVAVFNFAVDVTEQVRARHQVESLLVAERAARAEAERERERVTEARRAAEAASRAKSEFLATMSHELRTPLNAIGGYAELIELGIHGPVTAEQRTALERIQRSQRHLLGLIAGVLDYSRVEAGAVTYRVVEIPVAEAVAEAELLVAPQLRAKGLGYTWSGAPPGLCVRADREKLQQILLNLLGNAIKFTHARDGVPGRIEVACTVERSDDSTVGGHAHLHVRDTGEGIAADALERIFEPFVQADQRLTRSHGGVGLGLAISRDLARGMGGDLTAESTTGHGSTFTLTLPIGI